MLSATESVFCLGTLLLIACKDYRCRRIPNKLLICLLFIRTFFLAAFFAASFKTGIRELLSSGIALGITLVVTLVFYPFLKRKTPAGDWKLLMVCSFCLGVNRYLLSLLLCTGLLIVVYIYQSVRKQKATIPFAPYLFCGVLIATVFSYIFL